jgi:hypothetical protein
MKKVYHGLRLKENAMIGIRFFGAGCPVKEGKEALRPLRKRCSKDIAL